MPWDTHVERPVESSTCRTVYGHLEMVLSGENLAHILQRLFRDDLASGEYPDLDQSGVFKSQIDSILVVCLSLSIMRLAHRVDPCHVGKRRAGWHGLHRCSFECIFSSFISHKSKVAFLGNTGIHILFFVFVTSRTNSTKVWQNIVFECRPKLFVGDCQQTRSS